MTVEGVRLEPGSAPWLQLMTASKVAAVLGLAPETYGESPRSLWHLMRGETQPEQQTANQERGHYLEPAVLAWFFDHHPDLVRQPFRGTVVHDNGWAAATPDAEALDWDGDLVVVQAKTSADDAEWGTPGTAEVPTHYAAQCMWEMHVTGARRTYLPVLTTRLDFREYVMDYDTTVAAAIETRCRAFIDSLAGDRPPPLDAHPATYTSLRKLNPLIDEGARVDLDDDTAADFVAAVNAKRAAKSQLTFAKSRIANAMGLAQLAYCRGQLVARRQNTSGSTPAVYAAKPLPDIEKSAAA